MTTKLCTRVNFSRKLSKVSHRRKPQSVVFQYCSLAWFFATGQCLHSLKNVGSFLLLFFAAWGFWLSKWNHLFLFSLKQFILSKNISTQTQHKQRLWHQPRFHLKESRKSLKPFPTGGKLFSVCGFKRKTKLGASLQRVGNYCRLNGNVKTAR